MKAACRVCGRVHGSDWARAVGRFSHDGPIGFMASSGRLLRPTRAEAENDECRRRGGVG